MGLRSPVLTLSPPARRLLVPVVLALAGVLWAGEAPREPLPTLAAARAAGPTGLPRLLGHVQAEDPERRVRARRLVRAVVLDHLKVKTPAGMVLVPPRLTYAGATVRYDGGFYLGRSEVTRGVFRAFAQRQGWSLESWPDSEPNVPATMMSLVQARAYAKAQGARLPTADELRFAATGGHRFRYPWGDRFTAVRVHARESGADGLAAVDACKRGRSVHGILGLLGNAAEWTETTVGKRTIMYIAVGGSYRTHTRRRQFQTYRLAERASAPDVGFRLARSLPALPVPSEKS